MGRSSAESVCADLAGPAVLDAVRAGLTALL
jgi:hypothetical protein